MRAGLLKKSYILPKGRQMKKYNVAIVGATGAVGEEFFRVLEEVDFPINNLIPLVKAVKTAWQAVFFCNRKFLLRIT